MKTNRFYQFLAVAFCMMMCAACMDGDWDAPKNTIPPYGNNDMELSNVINISQLKALYPQYAADFSVTEMTEPAQLKVYVTGNDIADNLHNSLAVQDENGDALIIGISENSLFGYLPVGQEIIIDTKGLYIGPHSGQPQIGYPYTNANGTTTVGRMSSTMWNEHVHILPTKHEVVPVEYNSSRSLDKDCGKLMTIRGVEIVGADGKQKWAPEYAASGNAVSRYLVGYGTKIEIYTSTRCDFANAVMPTGKVNLTGIWKRYQNTWEVSLRSEDDVEPAE